VNRLPDNLFWAALNGPQRHYSVGTDLARRYAPGFSPLVAFADNEQPDLAALAPFCGAGERLYCAGWSGAAPNGWRVEAEGTVVRMIWDAPMPAAAEPTGAVRLGCRDAAQAQALAAMTIQVPFGLKTIELGEYFGRFDGDRLISMAGERLHAGTLREVSGVCTHPDFRGRGLARQLMLAVIGRQLLRGQTPFLQVMKDNASARTLYRRLGFREVVEAPVRIIALA
jgi:GNAT superfamily N-acetyltransferase